MGEVHVEAERVIEAAADTVFECLADFREHHPKFLPPAFSDFTVEEGGVGAGTVISYTLTAGGRTRKARANVDVPEPGRVLTESSTLSTLVTTFSLTPQGEATLLHIGSRWTGAGGIGGFFERTFAPRILRRIFDEELQLLDAYARGLEAPTGAAS